MNSSFLFLMVLTFIPQATILNLLLRSYLHFGLYDQADKLQAKSVVKEDTVSSNQLARFRYYQGKANRLLCTV